MARGETAELVDAAAVFTHEAPAIPRTASAGLKTPIHLETLPCMVTLLALRRNAGDRGTWLRARSMPRRQMSVRRPTHGAERNWYGLPARESGSRAAQPPVLLRLCRIPVSVARRPSMTLPTLFLFAILLASPAPSAAGPTLA